MSLLGERSTDRTSAVEHKYLFWLRAFGPVHGRMLNSDVAIFLLHFALLLQNPSHRTPPFVSPPNPLPSGPLPPCTPLTTSTTPRPPSLPCCSPHSTFTACPSAPPPGLIHSHPYLAHPVHPCKPSPQGRTLSMWLHPYGARHQPSTSCNPMYKLASKLLEAMCWLVGSACEVVKPLGFGL